MVEVVGRPLSAKEKETVANWPPEDHRQEVGGNWEVIGPLQLSFLIEQGLRPGHRLLDIGCGTGRGAALFVEYLDPGCYVGVDIERRILKRCREEIGEALWKEKAPALKRTSNFDFDGRGTFDYAIAQSLFTHLNPGQIGRCLHATAEVLRGRASLYATYNERETPRYKLPYPIMSEFPFSMLQTLASYAKMKVERIGKWGHPQNRADNQLMARFYCA